MPPRHGQRKILTKRKRSKSAPAVLRSPPKKAKRKQWTDEQMTEAMEAVRSGSAGMNEAARMHGVPPTTLKDRMSGKIKHGTKSGPQRYLNDEEESEFAEFLKESSTMGYGKTRRDVLRIAESCAKAKGVLRKERITQGWWRSFRERQGDLSLRRGDNTAHVRMDAVNEETISHYFSLLQEIMDVNDLNDSPGQIYNVDETGVPLDPKAPNIVSQTGAKKVRYRSTGRKGQITVVACGSATGQVIPPTIIFEGKRVNHAWTSNELPGMSYGCSDSGWITTELFESWLCEHFLKHAVRERPLLLLLDGHSTHYQPDLVRYAVSNQVLLLCLPPHTTHEAQPLDCTVFSPFKAQWRAVCHDFFQANPGKVITKFNFVNLFVKAWSQAVTPANVIAGFRTCGIYPVNSAAIRVNSSNTQSRVQSNQVRHSPGNDSTVACVHQGNTGDNGGDFMNDHSNRFTPEQEELFMRRFNEECDLFIDPDYVRWLRVNHPEKQIPPGSDSLLDLLPDDGQTPFDLPDHPSLIPVPSLDQESPGVSNSEEQLPASSEQSIPIISQFPVTSASQQSLTTPINDRSSTTVESTAPCIISPTSGTSTSPLTELLIYPVATSVTTPSTPAPPKRSIPKARLLTSDESLAALEEKEKAKKEALLEKERKKAERVAKKQQREEELKKKREERAKKAEEKAREKARKQQEKATRGRSKKQTSSQLVSATTEAPSTVEGTSIAIAATESTTVTTTTATSSDVSMSTTVASVGNVVLESTDCEVADKDDEVIDPNTCCMCFVNYEDDVLEGAGAQWIYCKCGRWVHEDCVEETVLDSHGEQRFCTFCVDKFTV